VAVEHGIWKIGETPKALTPIELSSELILEEQIVKDISILNNNWLLIGRQVYTDFGKYIDLLAIDANGSIIIIELKKHKTPRDVVAQAIDYASWIESLPSEKIVQIYESFVSQNLSSKTSLDEAFENKFGLKLDDEQINSSHQIVIVSAKLDASTERIINYLDDKAEVAINAVFFTVFQDGANQYLSRSWMIDPSETEENASNLGQKGQWNGEFYANFGVYENGRQWCDAIKYGFISAGGGHWYSKKLLALMPGDRVWINIPGKGYVGVAEVLKQAVIADEFITDSMALDGKYPSSIEVGEDDAEYFVAVRWVHQVNENQAVTEAGFFGNQNTVVRPKASKWAHTINRLKKIWQLDF